MGKYKRALALIICIMFLALGGPGCSKPQEENGEQDSPAPETGLLELLPDRAGYRWVYNGFAEYGHIMELKSIDSGEGETVYRLEGQVDDPSGGEAGGDFSLQVEYRVQKGVLFQERSSPKMMDNFAKMELLRLPLEENAQWEQRAKHRDGKEYQLLCTITEVKEEEGNKVYTVRYQDKNSDFYEERRIKEGTGVISFETVWHSNGEAIVMGYYLYPEVSGYAEAVALGALLPPPGREPV